MDEAAEARAAARGAIDDISPASLRELLDRRLRNAPMTPGVLTRLSARATDREPDPDELDRRSAGVQLIYDGLHLTRRLARTNPWEATDRSSEPDVDILAADVLVARGFYLLARTEAATKAVGTVRSFGRDETDRAAGRTHELADRSLEADVFEMAIIAGVSATGADPPAGVRGFAVDLAQSFDRGLPAAPELVSESAVDALAELVSDHDVPAGSPERIWAGSSVTDR